MLDALGWQIMGSGSSYHNMQGFFGQLLHAKEHSAAFDTWVTSAVGEEGGATREAKLTDWETAPYVRTPVPTSRLAVSTATTSFFVWPPW